MNQHDVRRNALPIATGIGLDVGGTKTMGIAISAEGKVLAQLRQATRNGPGGVLETAVEVIEQLRSQVEFEGRVGLGVPGLVNIETGVVSRAVNLDIEEVSLRDQVSAQVGLPVIIENDVKVAALGAASVLGVRDLTYVSIGTGLAAGLFVDGCLWRGSSGAAGEIGHLAWFPDGRTCPCGQIGCLETVVSGSALRQGHPSSSNAAEVFLAAQGGDVRASETWSAFIRGLATAVRLLVLTVDSPHIVLGGGVAELGETLRSQLAAELDRDDSAFTRQLALSRRLRLLPIDPPVAALGAALLGSHDSGHR